MTRALIFPEIKFEFVVQDKITVQFYSNNKQNYFFNNILHPVIIMKHFDCLFRNKLKPSVFYNFSV